VVVNAVVDLLQSGQFRPLRSPAGGAGTGSTGSTGITSGAAPRRSSSSLSGQHQQLSKDLAVAMDWVGGMLAAGRVTVQPAFVLQLLQHAAQQARGVEGEAREAREQAFVRMVQNVGVQQEGAAQQEGPAQLSAQEAHAALQLAEQASFHLAAAAIHHLRGEYPAALACHLAHTPAAAAFAYLDRSLSSMPSQPAALARFKAAVRAEMPRLIALDGLATAEVVLRWAQPRRCPSAAHLPPCF
jgi:hypothetical protein